jgi:RimJ/RimL family protein N-acetyltransferase
VELTDGVVRLRRYQGDAVDIDCAVPWYRDPDVIYYSEGPGAKPFSRARVARMYEVLAERGELYMIDVTFEAGWQTIGDVTLAEDTLPIVVGASGWRSRGIGVRALGLVIARARVLGWTKLRVRYIAADNIRSQRLFERCGFERTESSFDESGRLFYRYQLLL